MAWKTFIQMSRVAFGKEIPEGANYSRDDIELGLMQRIALSLENMSVNYVNMQNELDSKQAQIISYRDALAISQRSKRRYKGEVTKLRKEIERLKAMLPEGLGEV